MGFDIDGLDKLQDNLKQLAQTGVNELNKGLDKLNNIDGSKDKPLVPEFCPSCGAKLPIDKEAPVIKCAYCGAEYDNSATKSIVDSVFDFVEKQQQISIKEKERQLELQRLKAEKRAAKRKKSGFIKFILLIIVVFVILYYYFVIMGGTV